MKKFIFLGLLRQFLIDTDTDTFNLPYDYESITHYNGDAFSKNGLDTIKTMNPKNQQIIGNVKKLSKWVL